MFRRIMYHFKCRPFTYIGQMLMYLLLFVFFVSSLLTMQLSNVFDYVIGKNIDLDVTVYSAITYPGDDYTLSPDYLEKEQEYYETIQGINKQDEIVYTDFNVSMTDAPLKTITINEDGSFSVFMARSFGVEMQSLQEMYDWNNSTKISLKGITNANTYDLEHKDIVYYGYEDDQFITQEQIDNHEMVCVIPNAAYGYWLNSNTLTQEKRDVFTISTAVIDEVGNVIAYKSWDLKVVGTYMITGGTFGVEYEEATPEVPVYIPLGTLNTIRSEAIALQNEYDPDWMNDIYLYQSIDRVYPVTYEMKDLDATKSLIEYIQSTEAYQNGSLLIDSSLTENAPVLTGIYTVTSSFTLLAVIISLIALVFAAVSTCIYCLKARGELTLLEALGEKKKTATMQVVIETGIQLCISAIVSIPISLFIVRKFGIYLFDASVADRNSAMSRAIRTSFVLNEVHISEEISSLLVMTPTIILLLIVLAVVILIICLFISKKMISQFHPRELLAGGE